MGEGGQAESFLTQEVVAGWPSLQGIMLETRGCSLGSFWGIKNDTYQAPARHPGPGLSMAGRGWDSLHLYPGFSLGKRK